jgi:outer membrane autotransporter protein
VRSAPTTLDLSGGLLRNAGTLYVGGAGTIGKTTLTGDLVQSATGTIHIDVDPLNGRADLLQITGSAALSGTVGADAINPISFRKGTTDPVITAAGGITATPVVQGLRTLLFSQTAVVAANSLAIATDADFMSNDPANTATQHSLAGHLQQIWDSGSPGFEQGFARLPTIADSGAYRQTLDTLSGQEIAEAASARYEASQSFARNAFSCSAFADNQTIRTDTGCAWMRAMGDWSAHDANGGFPAFK